MNFLKRAYQVVLPGSVLLLAFLLYQEHQTRELAVTGARLDALELHWRLVQALSNAVNLTEVQPQIARAREHLDRALGAYRQRDFRVTRNFIHNAMWDLDVATTVLIVRTAPPETPEKNAVPAPPEATTPAS